MGSVMKTATAEYVRSLFDYRDGNLYWKHRVNSKVAAGSKAGTVDHRGYVTITIQGKKWHAHRLVWLWHGKELPPQLDHRDTDKANNRIENLRPADNVTNACNVRLKRNNRTGVKGVSWCNTYQKYVVQLYFNKRKVSGRFHSLDEAKMFADAKRQEIHGEFANDGAA
jgi:hypothetical protein